jgi:hypothetical protein
MLWYVECVGCVVSVSAMLSVPRVGDIDELNQSVSQVGDWTSLARGNSTYSVRLLVFLVQGRYGLVTEGACAMHISHRGFSF